MSAFHRLILAIFALFLISCEMNSVNKTVIYEPKKEVPLEKEVIVRDLSAIETFQNLPLSSLIGNYGQPDFTKLEMAYEFHRYNANNCRVFIQNNTNDKKIVNITIYNFQKNTFAKKFDLNFCS
jgi:hypothetical protein